MPRGPAGVSVVLFLPVLVLATLCGAEEPVRRPAGFGGVPAARLLEVLDRCYNLEDDAEAQIAALGAAYPRSLVPEFIAVARLYWMQSYVEVDAVLTEKFEEEALALLERTQKAMRHNPDDPDLVVLTALSHLTVGGFYAEHQRWWKAFWRVRAGRNLTLRVLKSHPDHPEAMMPAGVLECYLANTPPVLKPLARMMNASGDLDRGFELLETASTRAVLTANDATFYLCILQIGLRDDAESARRAMERLATRYPRNPYFQRLLGVCEVRSGQRAHGRARLAAVPAMPTVAIAPAIASHALMDLCRDFMDTGEYDRALDAADRAGTIASANERMGRHRVNALFAQAEALHRLARFDEAIERLRSVPASQAEAHKRASERIREIRAARRHSAP